ncbi:cysteine proteinase 1-like [Manduca sexta]|uniref:cysteine proteinase 1-like n=1 Tax=Manduca sexta TaxID=7130 RepID=UPI00188E4355|nr:cysteine proteinase 1-like [Manduca sexta]
MQNKTIVAFISTLLFAQIYSYLLKSDNKYNVSQFNYRPVNYGPVPDYYDWREQGMVSPVKNQLTCNACWAFCVVASIESHLKIYRNVEETLSEQFLIDCDEDKKGCGSASIIKTYADIVTKLGGVLRESDYYPYASRPLQCRWHPKNKELKLGPPIASPGLIPVVGFRRVLPDEEVMAQFIFQYGPLSAAINSASMARYRGGIDEPTDEDCNPRGLDHSILIVGYSAYVSKETGKTLPYWIIKNSWGVEWGDNGFYYLVRGRNACGIATDVSFAYIN